MEVDGKWCSFFNGVILKFKKPFVFQGWTSPWAERSGAISLAVLAIFSKKWWFRTWKMINPYENKGETRKPTGLKKVVAGWTSREDVLPIETWGVSSEHGSLPSMEGVGNTLPSLCSSWGGMFISCKCCFCQRRSLYLHEKQLVTAYWAGWSTCRFSTRNSKFNAVMVSFLGFSCLSCQEISYWYGMKTANCTPPKTNIALENRPSQKETN